MQSENLEIGLPPECLNNLDSALHRLGMLPITSDARREYLKERSQQPLTNLCSINTRFVSNVSIGFRMRPLGPHFRYKPYTPYSPYERRRTRTRSENNDVKEVSTSGFATTSERQIVENEDLTSLSQLKKAKSLESIVKESTGEVINVSIDGNCAELEGVSYSIQKLKVDE